MSSLARFRSIRVPIFRAPGGQLLGESLRLDSMAAWAVWMIGLTSCAWVAAFILFRTIQPYPLDAFEEYELHRAIRWVDGSALYGSPTDEPFPEAYPPLYFFVLGVWQKWLGPSFFAQRTISVVALAGTLGWGFWSFRNATGRQISRLVFVAAFLGLHAFTGRCFEVGKPDMLLTFFVSAAMVTGRHKSAAEVTVCSIAIWLASLTKQNGPLFIVPLALWHFAFGRRGWAILWSVAMVTAVVFSYAWIDWQTAGHFWRWVFVWTVGHGLDFGTGIGKTAQALIFPGPVVFVVLIGSILFRRRCLWTWFLVASLGVALLGMSKAGGRESHLLPVAFAAALSAGHLFRDAWQSDSLRRVLTDGSDQQSIDAVDRFTPGNRANWLVGLWRWALFTVVLLGVLPGLPARREFRWVAKRANEASEWVAAVQGLAGRVAVSHHLLLARRSGADCFFSDLILEFRGLEVPADVQRQIAGEQYDYIVLCDDPQSSTTIGWSRLIDRHYVPVGRLNYRDISGVLPNRVYRSRRAVRLAPRGSPGSELYAVSLKRSSTGTRSRSGMVSMTGSASCRLR